MPWFLSGIRNCGTDRRAKRLLITLLGERGRRRSRWNGGLLERQEEARRGQPGILCLRRHMFN